MSTLDLVSAIINKDATGIEEAFNAAMAEKISTQLDNMHTAVAQSMFSSGDIVSEDTISEEDYLNLSEEEQEEYEQIDELSKNTLGSYLKKASSDIHNKGMIQGAAAADHKDTGSINKKAVDRYKGIHKAVDKLSESDWAAEMPATKFSSADKNKSDALKKTSGKTNSDALKKISDAFAKKKSI